MAIYISETSATYRLPTREDADLAKSFFEEEGKNSTN